MIKDCEELSEIQIPLNTDDEIPLVAAQKRRRGKAIDWRFVKKFPTLDEARAEFSRGNLIGNEQFLGRKYTGKTSAIYINCQKITCGCNKKWRLVSSQSHPEVTLEETVEDHSNHEFFLRGGGNGLNSSQIKVTQEALLMNSRMRPLQILHYFRDRAARNSASDPTCISIDPPDIVRLSSYLSYQRRKDSGAVAANNKRKAAAKLGQHQTVPSDKIDENARKLIKRDNESATILM